MSRTVLVTGSARGIGRATAARFGKEGARVVVNYPPGERDHADETAQLISDGGGTSLLVEADLADPQAVQRMAAEVHEEWGALDVLVNNAGICPFKDFFDIDLELWDRVQHVNLRGAFLVTQAFTKRMVDEGKPGRVISVSSISAWVGGSQQVHYCTTKAGISSLMKSLAIVLGPHGITCNAVLPGAIATDINKDDWTNAEKLDYFNQRIPVGRIGQPDDIAGVIWLLSQPESSYLNGSDVLVDGGMFVNLQ
ncbi:SDR family NAD(P)-dependent oxidoreductase [Tenggerimyces flavus]|uniref:SDR family NAD(P)-dependent oxidoreductase n=1 Tax=Tenggerimyces flavus TaxID=1708749 RepID=A0ABV7Y6Q8_9ACTN|nr:SDR family NAD(P)-dependent oxidoreductase [Tenggerimyces flavus]MBM7791067.1 L-rhamnose 1-dehydrogenase [Tenggerimyces flavus]